MSVVPNFAGLVACYLILRRHRWYLLHLICVVALGLLLVDVLTH